MLIKLGDKKTFNIILVSEKESNEITYKLKGDFSGKKGEFLLVSEELVYFGIDEVGDENLGYRELGFNIGKFIKDTKLKEAKIDISLLKEEKLANFFLGLELSDYKRKTYKSDEKKEVKTKEVSIYIKGNFEADILDNVVREAKVLAASIGRTIDFVDAPSNLLYPLEFAKQIKEYFKDIDVEYKIISRKELAKMGMNLLLAVGDSSANEPCLVVLNYKGNKKSKEILGLVGKGVCMDTGGYCLKPSASIYDMKGDMGGAGAVVGAMKAIASMKLNVNVKAIIPLVENRISSSAFVPSDVIKSYSGKTVEIHNTDAEGRLILADSITYAIKDEKVTKVIDIATLTGAVVMMLGQSITGVLSNNDEFYNIFDKSSLAYGERHSRMPYYKEHEDMIKSKFADIKNLGAKYCGAITAGLFLKEFASPTPWIHFDIAGTSKVDSPIFSYEKEGATGAGVVQLYNLAKEMSK